MGYESTLSSIGMSSYHHRVIFISSLSNASDAVEIIAISFVISAGKQDLGMNNIDQGILTSILFFGMMFGAWICGLMADQPNYGRKKVLIWSLLANGICGLLSAFAFNFSMLLIIRFCSGLAVGGSVPVTFTYAAEFLPKQKRGMYLAILAVSWPVAATLTSLFAFAIIPHIDTIHVQYIPFPLQSWRIFLIGCSVPAFIASFAFKQCADQSPKFLIYTKRNYSAARDILLKMYETRFNDTNVMDTELLQSTSIQSWVQPVQNLDYALLVEDDCSIHTKNNGTVLELSQTSLNACANKSETKLSNIMGTSFLHKLCVSIWTKTKALFDKPYRRVHILAGIVWFTLSFGFYGLAEWLPTYFGSLDDINEYKSNIATSVAQLPGAILTCWFLEFCCDRKTTLSVSIALGTMSLFALPYLESSSQIVIMMCVFNGVTVCGWTALDVISTELSPTHIRSTAVGFFTAMGRIGAICGNMVFGWFGHDDIASALPICGVVLAFGTLACLSLPSTKGIAIK
eukprot:378319_1